MATTSPPPQLVIQVRTLACTRCHHQWYPRSPDLPRVCPTCKSPYWDRPRKVTK